MASRDTGLLVAEDREARERTPVPLVQISEKPKTSLQQVRSQTMYKPQAVYLWYS